MTQILIEASDTWPATGSTGANARVSFDAGAPYSVTITDPFTQKEEQQLAWYFEEHLYFPLVKQVQAREAAGSIVPYGEQLFAQVFADRRAYARYVQSRNVGVQTLQFELVGPLAFHALHWEALKDPEVAHPFVLEATMVRKNMVPVPFEASVRPSPTINILVVTARPKGKHDPGYRTISLPLVEALRQANVPVQIEFVRPGTYTALEQHLARTNAQNGPGYYHVIHFDVHGAILTYDELCEGEPPSRYLGHNRPGVDRPDLLPYPGEKAFLLLQHDEEVQADPIEASELAQLLQPHQIPIVLLNACQSGKVPVEGPPPEVEEANAQDVVLQMVDEISLFKNDEFEEIDAPTTFKFISEEATLRGEFDRGYEFGVTGKSPQKQVEKGKILFGEADILAIPSSLPSSYTEIEAARKGWDLYLVCLYFTLRTVSADIHYQSLTLSLNLSTRQATALALFPKEILQNIEKLRYEPFPGYLIKFPPLQPTIQVEGERFGQFQWHYRAAQPASELTLGDRKAVILLRVPSGTPTVIGKMQVKATLKESGVLGVPIQQPQPKTIRWDVKQSSLLEAVRVLKNNVVVVIAASRIEYDVMRSYLTELREEVHPAGDIYERGMLPVDSQTWDVILRVTGEQNSDVALDTEHALARFQPTFALFLGSATGIKDLSPGDVVVALKTYGYESALAMVGTNQKARPDAFRPTYKMQELARFEAGRSDASAYSIKRGAVASGGKELGSANSSVWTYLHQHFNDTLAVDTQGLGFLQALHANHSVESLAVYGIAQCLPAQDTHLDPKALRRFAAQHACDFALEVLKKFK